MRIGTLIGVCQIRADWPVLPINADAFLLNQIRNVIGYHRKRLGIPKVQNLEWRKPRDLFIFDGKKEFRVFTLPSTCFRPDIQEPSRQEDPYSFSSARQSPLGVRWESGLGRRARCGRHPGS